MIQRTLLLIHLLGLGLTVIAIVVLELRIAVILVKRQIRRFNRSVLEKFIWMVRGGLALVWSSTLTLGACYALTSPHLLTQSGFWFQIISGIALTLNALLIKKFFSRLVDRTFDRPVMASLSLIDRFKATVGTAAAVVQPYCLALVEFAKSFCSRSSELSKNLTKRNLPAAEASDNDGAEKSELHKDIATYVVSCSRDAFLYVGGFSLIINLLMLTSSLYMMQIFDRVISSQSRQTLLYLTIIAILAMGVLGVLDLIRSRILSRIGTWVEQSLSSPVYLKGLDNALVGRPYRTEALRDLSTVKGFLSGSGVLALFDAPWVPIYLAVVYLLNPVLGHIALVGAILLGSLAYATDRFTAKILTESKDATISGLRHAESAFRNAEVIHSMGMGQALTRLWHSFNKEAIALGERASDRNGTISAISKFLRPVLQIAVLGAGALLVLDHQLTAGGMIAASIIMGRALAPVEQSIGTWKHTVAARSAWQRICVLLRQAPLYSQATVLPRPTGHLTIEGVSYCPPGCSEAVLSNLTLEAKPGEILAITGPSAAGKSTLARLIVGLARPQVGSVRLDGAEIGALDHGQFGRYIGYLPQDVELFPGSIYRNIARMTDGTPNEVIEAAHLAGVHEMILRLPLGYDTEIGERGASLSGGQRQRIALARALYGRPALLVLDEPNASLDSVGEEALGRAIESLKECGSTIIVIAHRPAVLTRTDRIAVLMSGRLNMIGERDEVLPQIALPRPARIGHVRVVR
jgi:PrtD family type I secretion system ABC transporter